MKEIKIEHLVYLLKQAKEKNAPQPIFFLGAGASRSGQIPLANEIIAQILRDYSDSPFIKDKAEKDRTYAKLMECLLPAQRDELLKNYISNAKINVTHIYLAQLIAEGYVDYVLTVNFDNLMLRALALYNIFPSTYDMAILKDFTTSTFKEKSVVYLHGQSHGPWLLNTNQEMEKVKNTVPRIFDSIKNKRPWIFIGYSGEDLIFEHIQKLGRFDNGLYWIAYKENNPKESVQQFLTHPDTNAFIIKGFDSDSFMLKLNKELGLAQPTIVDKPFTALQDMLEEIVDIDEQEHFKGVKERLEISKRQVKEAIQQFELGKLETEEQNKVNHDDLLKKQIINLIIEGNYNEDVIAAIETKVYESKDSETQNLFADLLYNWGYTLTELAKTKTGKEAKGLYQEAIDKYRKAVAIKPDKHEAFNNWGNVLGNLANISTGKEAEDLYQEAINKYRKALAIKPNKHEAYYNWGIYLGDLAKTKTGKEAKDLYQEAIDKYRKAIAIKPDYHEAYYNWGVYLGDLAKTNTGKEAEDLYQEAIDKYRKAIAIKPDMYETYDSLGLTLVNLAKTKTGKEAEDLYQEALKKYLQAIVLGGSSYNLACMYAIQGKFEEALFYLDKCLVKNEISIEFVQNDEDWKAYLDNSEFIMLLNKYRNK